MTRLGGKSTIEVRRGLFLLAALSALGALCLIVIVGSGTAQSQQSGTLACVKQKKPRKGSVRIPSNGLCHSNERGLVLNRVGPQGPPGTGVSGHQRVSASTPRLATDLTGTTDVNCPAGKSVLGGGFDIAATGGDSDKIFGTASFPIDSDTWRVRAEVVEGAVFVPTGPWILTAWAACATA